jgi:hypothetical protein
LNIKNGKQYFCVLKNFFLLAHVGSVDKSPDQLIKKINEKEQVSLRQLELEVNQEIVCM